MTARLALLLLVLAGPGFPADRPTSAADRLFAVRFTPGPAWDPGLGPGAQPGMADHGAQLGRLRREGRIQFGARYGDTGLVVFRAADEAAVRALLASDPTVRTGVFTLAVDPFAPFYHGSTRLTDSAETAVLRTFLAAADAADADALATICAAEVAATDLAAGTVRTGPAALRAALAARDPAGATRRTELLAIEQTGAFLSTRERAVVTSAGGPRREHQQVVLYRIADGRIQALWTGPAEPSPAPSLR
jgi:uncharacterized protein YciI